MLDTSESAFPTSIPILSVAVSATRKREHSCGTLQCNDNHSSLQLPVTAVTIPLMCQVTLHDGCYLVSLLTVHRIGTLCYFLCSKPGGWLFYRAVLYSAERPGWRRSAPGHGRSIWQHLRSRQIHLKFLITWDLPCTCIFVLISFDEWQLSCRWQQQQ